MDGGSEGNESAPPSANSPSTPVSTPNNGGADTAPSQTPVPAADRKPASRDNSSAVETVLFSGGFEVESDIPAGRYVITGKGAGNFIVYNRAMPVVNEILDDGSLGFSFGVSSVTVDLSSGQTIEISGLKEVTFTPAVTELSTTLTTGKWVVGLDIPAGKYDAVCNDGQSGNLFVYEGTRTVVNEILDKSGMGIGVEKVRVNLKDKQEVHISSLNEVIFEGA